MTMPLDELSAATARLVVSRDGQECTIGRPDLGIYVAVPEAGVIFVETLQSGGSPTEAAKLAGQAAGQPVDGADFLTGIAAIGLLDGVDTPGQASPSRPDGRPIRWIEGVSPRIARRIFGRFAWSIYTASAAFCLVALCLVSAVRPSYEDWWFLGDPVQSLALLLPIGYLLRALHEAWHWLAGRAIGVPATFRVSRRGPFLVFETDLTQLVALPRRSRYGPFLAGTAFDGTVLAAALALRLLDHWAVLDLAPAVSGFLGAVILLQITGIVFQFAVFLRSDGYAVLANALRCNNLYRASWLTLKGRLLRLTASDRSELAGISDHDRRVARWFSVVYLAGMLGIAWFVLTFGLPNLVLMTGWIGANLASGPVTSLVFWESLALLLLMLTSVLGPPLIAVRERRLRRRGVLL